MYIWNDLIVTNKFDIYFGKGPYERYGQEGIRACVICTNDIDTIE